MTCPDPTPSTTITIPYEYQMGVPSSFTAVDVASILLNRVDAAIASHAEKVLEQDCSVGVVSVNPGYTDHVVNYVHSIFNPTKAQPACKSQPVPGNCFPVTGYVVATYDPAVLDSNSTEDLVLAAIAGGMGDRHTGMIGRDGGQINKILIADDIEEVEYLRLETTFNYGNGDILSSMEFIPVQVSLESETPSGYTGRHITPGGIAGIVAGSLALLALLLFVAFRLRQKKEEEKEEAEAVWATEEDDSNGTQHQVDGEMIPGIDDELEHSDIGINSSSLDFADFGAGDYDMEEKNYMYHSSTKLNEHADTGSHSNEQFRSIETEDATSAIVYDNEDMEEENYHSSTKLNEHTNTGSHSIEQFQSIEMADETTAIVYDVEA